jgi:DNA-binding response OmpR family regulator
MIVGIVERNQKNLELMKEFFERHGYEVVSARDYEEFDELSRAEIVFVDIAGFDRRIWDKCEWLREKNTPFVLIYPKRVEKVETRGAEAVLFKPLNPRRILELLKELSEDK